jgi:DNA (cytosine-5)-methyltransferase 1
MSQSKKRGDAVRVLDLFSGIGGFSLAARWAGMETAAFCEIDSFCQKVLKKNFPGVKIYDDIRTLTKEQLEKDGVIDDSRTVGLVCGGIPCQPFSLAGKQRGINDERYLWPEMYRIIRELRPPWVLIENVVGFVKLALDLVIDDLEDEGYEARAFIIPASAVGAPHRRDRIWIVAHADSVGNNTEKEHRTNQNGPEKMQERKKPQPGSSDHGAAIGAKAGGKRNQSRMGRGFDGVPARMDKYRWPARRDQQPFDWEPPRMKDVKYQRKRLKALGNTIVPQVAYQILWRIMEVEKSYAAQRI